jgi:hypothetical protein
MNVVVQIPAFEEGRQLTETAEQVVAQPTPEFATVDVEAWVTLSPPDRSLCTTWQAAMDAKGVGTFEAPQGKLTARNAAHDSAVERGYDVIVTWDADAPPLRDDTLLQLLAPFEDQTVVATNSKPAAATTPNPVDRLIDVVGYTEDAVRPHLHGQCSAFRAAVWADYGGFDTTTEQSEIDPVRKEEEFGLYDAFSKHGKIVNTGALVYNDPRRHYCKWPLLGDPSFCKRRSGEATFAPDEQRRR